jgi:tRNA-specific 2-thiouridylase
MGIELNSKSKRVVVGLSGGVDSSVAAYLLKEQGYEVIALFMRNWDDSSVILDDECPWIEDSNDAMMVAEKLDIPYHVIDLSEIYKDKIVDYMFNEYKMGRTPNPDVLCNREIKFDVFLKAALDLGADYIATGHYCRKEEINTKEGTKYRLLAGLDKNKDQSYFLCQLNQAQLSKSLFPIGHLEKLKVREIATEQGFVTANKKDSQGLCFIGKVSLPDFLQQQLKPKMGDIIEVPNNSPLYLTKEIKGLDEIEQLNSLSKRISYNPSDGIIVGQHNGAHFYTKGQRKGLNVGGTKEPLFVIETDVKNNIIYVGQGKNHLGLFKKGLFIKNEDIHWVRPDLKIANNETLNIKARIRYRQQLENAKLTKTETGLYIIFKKVQTAITEGQFAVWYIADELIGSGVID